MLYITFVSRCLKCCHGVGFLHTSPQAPLGSQRLSLPSAGGGVVVGAWASLGAGFLRWGGEASEGCSGPRLVCRGDNVFPSGDVLLHDWGLCPWDLCLPSTPPLPRGQVKGRREEERTAGVETPPPAPQQD